VEGLLLVLLRRNGLGLGLALVHVLPLPLRGLGGLVPPQRDLLPHLLLVALEAPHELVQVALLVRGAHLPQLVFLRFVSHAGEGKNRRSEGGEERQER
jgi:hypothetical protein